MIVDLITKLSIHDLEYPLAVLVVMIRYEPRVERGPVEVQKVKIQLILAGIE